MLGLIFTSMQTFADTRAQALLLHNGQGTSFDADQLQEAVNAAVAGDTIYLSEGTFTLAHDSLAIDKEISIVGAGVEVCKIGGVVTISIDGKPTLKQTLLESVKITRNVEVQKEVRGISLRKCWVGGWFSPVTGVTDIKIDRCYLQQLTLEHEGKMSITLNNCIIFTIGTVRNLGNNFSEGNDVNFINCSISNLRHTFTRAATYQNCIIGGSDVSGVGNIYNNTFINTLLNTVSDTYNPRLNGSGIYIYTNVASATNTGNVKTNCYESAFTMSYDGLLNNFPIFKITAETLRENRFLGTDGTVVGAYGGATPYSQQSEGIAIKESILRVDPETKQLNVTLKVATE